MRVITPALLVTAVTQLSTKHSPLVRERDVAAWCDRNLVDYRGDGLHKQAIWDADLEEARGEQRLLKFKSGDSKQSRVGWALVAHGDKAREAAARKGWHEMVWTGARWEWLQVHTPSSAPGMGGESVGGEAAWG